MAGYNRMKTVKGYTKWLLVFIIGSMILCGRNNVFSSQDTFGTPISNQEITSIAELFEKPDIYSGKTVTLKGMMDMQDEKGRWFYLHDEKARIFIDRYASGFTVPDLTNTSVRVEGKIEMKLKIPSIIATGVEYKSSSYTFYTR